MRYRHHPHIIPPSHAAYATKSKSNSKSKSKHAEDRLSNVTLRQFLSHPDGFHLGLAPAFFGFYCYFGVLTAFHEHVLTEEELNQGKILLPVGHGDRKDGEREGEGEHQRSKSEPLLKSVAGASAGAMAAVLLAAGLNPRESADFASEMTVHRFWDFPGFGGVLKGRLFETIMVNRLKRSGLAAANSSGGGGGGASGDGVDNVQLEDGLIPVAVSGFDILTFKNKIMTRGCMGKAARASASFPGLFQPCSWKDTATNIHNDADDDDGTRTRTQYLMDGGILDSYGLAGLGHLQRHEQNKRVVNVVAGTYGSSGPCGPSSLPEGLDASEVVSISIEGVPQCGPWAMANGPRAVEAARKAIVEVLDVPMYHGREEGHYVLHVDAKAFIPK